MFRRVMECVASGLFLPGGPGLCDPCEKDPVDAAGSLTAQERANITLSAQVSTIGCVSVPGMTLYLLSMP